MRSSVPALFPEVASTMASRVDALYLFLVGLSAFFSILIAVMVVVFMVKFKRKDPNDVGARIHGGMVLEITWSVVPLIISLGILRTTSFRQYVTVDQFWGLSKLLLALSLLWFYFWWSSFIAFWYGKKPAEEALIQLMMFGGPYVVPFTIAWFGCFGIPLFTLMWNNVRKSIRGPIIVSIIILIGNFFGQIRLYVGPWSLVDHGGELVTTMPSFTWPDLADILIVPGLIGGAAFVVLMTARTVPLMNLWEMKEGLLYRTARRYLRAPRVLVVAKPE